MSQIQNAVKSFLVYWFTLSVVPGLINDTNQFSDLALASFGFSIIFMILPGILAFFKFKKDHLSALVLIGGLLSIAYTFILKPGILGLIYFPQGAAFGQVSSQVSLLHFELDEFGIIIFVGILSIVLAIFLDRKFK